ncbi:hypothetical protein EYF80_036646 [Liparis tanakae]|uniref:Uncharacterized protein n=1 Tax=Liparis tanakae TaxID=230148 RepID=A0A4Z2GHU7_9TELE|nr:hypothetical protein EYF80_036646 [Liparis tanakae]
MHRSERLIAPSSKFSPKSPPTGRPRGQAPLWRFSGLAGEVRGPRSDGEEPQSTSEDGVRCIALPDNSQGVLFGGSLLPYRVSVPLRAGSLPHVMHINMDKLALHKERMAIE